MVFVLYPAELIVKVAPVGTSILNCPSELVEVPVLVGNIIIDAAEIGRPFISVIRPEVVYSGPKMLVPG